MPKQQTFSGFVIRRRPGKIIQEWIGCGTEDELHAIYISMQDDAVVDNKYYPGDLVIEPATEEEIATFRDQAGDGWIPPHARGEG